MLNSLHAIDSTYKHMYPDYVPVDPSVLAQLPCVVEPVKTVAKQQKSASYLSDPDWTSLFQEIPHIYKTSLSFATKLKPLIDGKDG